MAEGNALFRELSNGPRVAAGGKNEATHNLGLYQKSSGFRLCQLNPNPVLTPFPTKWSKNILFVILGTR